MFNEKQQSTAPQVSLQKLEEFMARVEALVDKFQSQSRELLEAKQDLLRANEQIESWKRQCQELTEQLTEQLKSDESEHHPFGHSTSNRNGTSEGTPSTYLPQQPPLENQAIERQEVQVLLKEIEECIALVSMTI